MITFNNLQAYVRISLSTDGTGSHQPAGLRVSYFQDTSPTNALFTQDGGGNIEYTDANTGIKMLIVDTHFAENDIDEIEFRQLGQAESKPTPESLIVLGGFHQAIPLAWQAPATRTLQGYNMSRGTTSGGAYVKIAGNIQNTFYRYAVYMENAYYYVVSAVYSDWERGYSAEKSAQGLLDGYTRSSHWTASTPTIDGVINSTE